MFQLPGNLKVIPNPWGVNPLDIDNPRVDAKTASHGLDPEGRPAHTVFYDIHGHKMAFGWVGAEINKRRTVVLQQLAKGDDQRSARQRTVWDFCGICAEDEELAAKLPKVEPLDVPPTGYYLRAVAQGGLLPADEATARRCGVKFRPLAGLCKELEGYAHAAFNANYQGADAIAHFREMVRAEIAEINAKNPKTQAPTPSSVPVVENVVVEKKKGAQ